MKVALGHSSFSSLPSAIPPSAVALLLLPFRLQPDNKERDVFSRQVFAGLFLLSTRAEKWKTLFVSSVCCLHHTLSLSSAAFCPPTPPNITTTTPSPHLFIHSPCSAERVRTAFYKAWLAVTLDMLSFVNKTKSRLDLQQHKAIWGLNLGQWEAGLMYVWMYQKLIRFNIIFSIPTSEIRKPF